MFNTIITGTRSVVIITGRNINSSIIIRISIGIVMVSVTVDRGNGLLCPSTVVVSVLLAFTPLIALGLLHECFVPMGRPRLRDCELHSISNLCAPVLPAALPAWLLSMCLNIRLHATAGS